MADTRSIATQTKVSYLKRNKKKVPKFYAVRIGRVPGIYRRWDECYKQINQFSKAQYKSFKTERDAQIYMRFGKVIPVDLSSTL